ncbi:hypothetical protein LTR29_017135 [Friedmanniomyces endolithicus]|uniref:Uncharacterized protein n=2 Tax=Friedmanniomyces endolithicus TaxID=329885 RepID=A0AAN6IZ42_9PEZI|nr:hypothetical protein LTS09_018193 [Friedmanniomyces endolithicus]KAK0262718.1 hypothetical protein LTR35_017685 [Friedmanniomyces endolithicus]KAK0268683.1 hypothetical protein LTS00_017502 [Friedmanniomyces endolithicus]KAK0301859.1 hypothetical protein LTR82_018096 [Friedmanniomyces endolithicus]KAK0929256.1 hypothetical protein LTR29_017135 [Friedmanniomyces endolithicus]
MPTQGVHGFFVFCFQTMAPCSRGERLGLSCKVRLSTGRCGECNDSNGTCDLVLTRKKWEAMKKEHRKLHEEALAAEEGVERAHAALAVALAKRSRLSKQLLYVEDRAARALDKQEEIFEKAELVEIPVVVPELDLSSLDSLGVPGEAEMAAMDWSFVDQG